MRPSWPALLLLGLAACDEPPPPRLDDLSALVGDYERPTKDIFGEVETATLVVTQRGMTFAKDPKRDSVVFDRVECASPTVCEAKSVLCSITLEKRADGDLMVHAELRCGDMAGVWHTHENAMKKRAELTGSAGVAPPVAPPATAPPPSAAPPSAPSGSSSARSLSPPPGDEPSTVDCLRSCNQASMTCARRCKSGDLPCLSSCNADGFRCVVGCSR